jgi:hypothetical protein
MFVDRISLDRKLVLSVADEVQAQLLPFNFSLASIHSAPSRCYKACVEIHQKCAMSLPTVVKNLWMRSEANMTRLSQIFSRWPDWGMGLGLSQSSKPMIQGIGASKIHSSY